MNITIRKTISTFAFLLFVMTAIPSEANAQDEAPQNVAIYASKRVPISFAEIEKLAPDAKVKLLAGKKESWESVEIKWPEAKIKFTRASIESDKTLVGHLNNFSGYVFQRLAEGKMDAHVFSIIRQISKTNHLYSVEADPDISSDAVGDFVKATAGAERALVFVSVKVFDANMKTLLGPASSRDEDAELPKFDSSAKRKQRSMKSLAERKLKVLPGLPWIVADEQVRMREAKDVARRAVCLCALAASAEADSDFDATKFLTEHKLMDHLSPAEIAFLKKEDRTAKENSVVTWRYEAAWSLLWALNHFDEIGFPDSQSDAKKSLQLIMNDPQTLIDNARLRPTTEILDSADLFYRCMWICRDARGKGKAPEGVSTSVVYERLYALNWLIRHGNNDWDDVQTDS